MIGKLIRWPNLKKNSQLLKTDKSSNTIVKLIVIDFVPWKPVISPVIYQTKKNKDTGKK